MLQIALTLIIFASVSEVSANAPEESSEISAPTVGNVGGVAVSFYNFTSAPNSAQIFASHFGAENPVDAFASSKGYQSYDKNNPKFVAYNNDLRKYYGDNDYVNAYSKSVEDYYSATAERDNSIRNIVGKAKGEAGEWMMDDFYKSEGWEKIDSKVGVKGIDSIYVKRSPSGKITKYMISESKTGQSNLGKTNFGDQMSPNWIRNNLVALKNHTTELLKDAQKRGDKKDIEALQAKLRDLDQIILLEASGSGQKNLHQTSIVMKSGQPVLRMEFYKVIAISDTEVEIRPRTTKNGSVYAFEIPLDGSKTTKLTKTQRKALNQYFDGFKKALTDLKIPPKLAGQAVDKIRKDIFSGKIKFDGQNFDAFVMNSITNYLLKHSKLTPKQAKALKAINDNAIIGLPHSLSYAKAGVYGALFDGAFSAFNELVTTGRITTASAENALIGGGFSAGSAVIERGFATGLRQLNKSRLIKQFGGKGFEKFIKSPFLSKAGGVVAIVVLSAGTSAYNYIQGNISGSQFLINTGETIAVGFAMNIVRVQIGAVVGSFIPIPLVGALAGIGASIAIGYAYDWVKSIFVPSSQPNQTWEIKNMYNKWNHQMVSLYEEYLNQKKLEDIKHNKKLAQLYFDEVSF
jgi:hypothetical protein